ncbi:unnamed protein product [Lota lota]
MEDTYDGGRGFSEGRPGMVIVDVRTPRNLKQLTLSPTFPLMSRRWPWSQSTTLLAPHQYPRAQGGGQLGITAVPLDQGCSPKQRWEVLCEKPATPEDLLKEATGSSGLAESMMMMIVSQTKTDRGQAGSRRGSGRGSVWRLGACQRGCPG